MNWGMISAILAVVGPIGVAIFLSGRLTQRIEQNEDSIAEMKNGCAARMTGVVNRLDGHDLTLGLHSVQIAKAEAWRDGFSAGRAGAPASHIARG